LVSSISAVLVDRPLAFLVLSTEYCGISHPSATAVAALDVLFILVAVPEMIQGVLSVRPKAGGLVGILSVVAQTGVLLLLTQAIGTKHTITLEENETETVMKQNVVKDAVTTSTISLLLDDLKKGYRIEDRDFNIIKDKSKLASLGPALFGFIFYQFDMDLNIDNDETGHVGIAQFPAPRIRPQTISIVTVSDDEGCRWLAIKNGMALLACGRFANRAFHILRIYLDHPYSIFDAVRANVIALRRSAVKYKRRGDEGKGRTGYELSR
uniref:Uncharacterized protein n=1 Tax=Parascaris equorum TaxID=6256 RepID=A0A914S759_PAREQ